MSTKKIIPALICLLSCAPALSAQESLKGEEEEYYDFLSLSGGVSRPTLGYRTLSDNRWETGHFPEEAPGDVTEPGRRPGTGYATGTGDAASYGRTAQIWAGNGLGSSRILLADKIDGGLRLKIHGPEWFNSYNSAFPYGQNDGALWQGRGYNTCFSMGATLEAKGFSITIKPLLAYSRNEDFRHQTGVFGSEYSYFWQGYAGGGIDLVQRYGNRPHTIFDWGDSELRYSWRHLTAGAGFQSPWLGPAWLNPIMGSNNAPSYPKLDFGLRKCKLRLFKWEAGEIEARIWAGMLRESEYFDMDGATSKSLLSALNFSYAPSFWPGLSVGFNRIFLTAFEAGNLRYLAQLFIPKHINTAGSTGEDQKFSIYLDQMVPSLGLEAYAEIGSDDFSSDYISNPFHTMVYTLGAKKSFKMGRGHAAELIVEMSDFEFSQDFQFQWAYLGFYSHGQVKRGYTNLGQIAGAGSGYAGNSQFAALKFYHPRGYVMPYLHRSCPDNNYINAKAIDSPQSDTPGATETAFGDTFYAVYKTYAEAGVKAMQFVAGSLQLSAGASVVYNRYPSYTKGEDPILNFRFSFCAKYNL